MPLSDINFTTCFKYTDFDSFRSKKFLVIFNCCPHTYQGRWFWDPVWQFQLKLACNVRQLVQQYHRLIHKIIDAFQVVLQ